MLQRFKVCSVSGIVLPLPWLWHLAFNFYSQRRFGDSDSRHLSLELALLLSTVLALYTFGIRLSAVVDAGVYPLVRGSFWHVNSTLLSWCSRVGALLQLAVLSHRAGRVFCRRCLESVPVEVLIARRLASSWSSLYLGDAFFQCSLGALQKSRSSPFIR